MSIITERWLQEVASSVKIPALSPAVTKVLLPFIESSVQNIIRLAQTFQRHGKSDILSVDDINLALYTFSEQLVYGYLDKRSVVDTIDNENSLTLEDAKVSLVELTKSSLPTCPLMPECELHWLAVEGVTPRISQNISLSSDELLHQPLSLPKEMQLFYSRITGLLLSDDTETISATFRSLQSDPGLQELVPFLCRFVLIQVKASTRKLHILWNLVRTIHALFLSPHIQLNMHLHQILPALFTCVVGARLCAHPSEDHWSLRMAVAELVAAISRRFREAFPELLSRICKTYLEALSGNSPLTTIFGGLVGLGALGQNIIRTVLLPHISFLPIILASPSALSSNQQKETVDEVTNKKIKQTTSNGIVNGLTDTAIALIKSTKSILPMSVIESSGTVIIKEGNSRKRSREGEADEGVHKVMTERERCRSMLLLVLGRYIHHAMSKEGGDTLGYYLQSQTQSNRGGRRKNKKMTASDNPVAKLIEDLNVSEALVPYYARSSQQWDDVYTYFLIRYCKEYYLRIVSNMDTPFSLPRLLL